MYQKVAKLRPGGRYCMYLRRSRLDIEEEKRGAGETLARHHKMLMEMANRLGIYVAEDAVYREIVSGDTIAERPVVQTLLADVEKGKWDGVVTAEVDRLARGATSDQGIVADTFLYTHTLIITPFKIYNPDDPSDREFFEMKLYMARREYDQIKRRLTTGRENSVKAGLYAASRPPYGYRRYKLPNRKGYSLAVDKQEAAVVRMIFDWYVHGMGGKEVGPTAIANELIRMGFKTNYGKTQWNRDTVLAIIRNTAYIGMVRWNQRVQVIQMSSGIKHKRRVPSENQIEVMGLHDPIIDRTLFEQAQTIRLANARPSVRRVNEIANPFSGLLICGQCGRRMTRQVANAKYPEYETVKCPTSHCPTSGIKIALLEQAVVEELRNWYATFSDFNQTDVVEQKKSNPLEDALRSIEKQRETVTSQISRLRDLLEQGVYTVDVYKSRMMELNARMEDLENQISELSKTPPVTVEDAIRMELPEIASVLELYDFASTPAQKNALLKSVIGYIVYHKTERTRNQTNPLSYLTLEIYPIIPEG